MSHPNNPFLQLISDANTGTSTASGSSSNISQQDIEAVFHRNQSASASNGPSLPAIHIETAPQDLAEEEEENPPQLPARPQSPSLPQRPQSPSLPPRPQLLQQSQQHLDPLPQQLDIPSPLYTPVASPNETLVSADDSQIPAFSLQDGSNVTQNEIEDDVPPPPYSEADPQLLSQIFTPPFSNTGGHTQLPYQRPSHPPPPRRQQFPRPTGPPPTQYNRPGVPPPNTRPSSSAFPGRANLTYGNAAYNANQPPLPPRR